MLVGTGAPPLDDPGWAFEPKLDGWRALVHVRGRVVVRSRIGRDITASVPEFAALGDAIRATSAVLDAELIAGAGTPEDFYRLGRRLSATTPSSVNRSLGTTPLHLCFFDVLHLNGDDLVRQPYDARRERLDALELSAPRWSTVRQFGDGYALLAASERLGLEGVVAKRRASAYRPGQRTRHWVKLKTVAWRREHAWRRRPQR